MTLKIFYVNITFVMKRFLTLALILSFSVQMNSVAFAHEEELEFFHPVKITRNKPLNIMDCVSLAYQNSPKIKRQKYNLDIAKSNLGIARSAYFPVISAGTGIYNEYNSDSVYYDKHYRDLPSVGVSINKMVWDFGKTTANIKMEEFYKIGAEYEFMDSLCATLFDVKWKYYNLLRTKALLDIYEDNLKIAETFLKKSTKSPDKETSLIYVTEAKILYEEALDEYKNAKVDLDNSMYLPNSVEYTIESTDTFGYDLPDGTNMATAWEFKPMILPFKREDAPKIAYKNSPDLHVLIATKRAMKESLKYVKRSYFPELSANAGYGYNNTFNASNNSFRVGVNLDSSVNLMELKHSIKGADANVNLAQNEIDLFKKDLYYEIQRATNKIDKALSQIPLARESVEQAYKTMNLVVSKYGIEDNIDYTSLHEARENYLTANINFAESLYKYNTALIQLEMATHSHIVDIHHKSGHAVHHHSEELISDLIKALECKNTDKDLKKKSLLFGNDKDLDEDEDL